jgi:hypothetical protein
VSARPARDQKALILDQEPLELVTHKYVGLLFTDNLN